MKKLNKTQNDSLVACLFTLLVIGSMSFLFYMMKNNANVQKGIVDVVLRQ